MSSRAAIAKALADRIRAWHASPHDFDKFDLSKIGTGQGAASYGHGIYAAENPKVSGVGGEYWKEFAGHFTGSGPGVDPVVSHAVQYLEHLGGDRKAALEMVKGAIEKTGNAPQRPRLEAVRDLLASDKPVGPRVYELDIKARPEQFLDWDKPLNVQDPTVRSIVTQKIEELGAAPRYKADKFLVAPMKEGPDEYRALGSQIYTGLAANSQANLSRRLADAGIPGIRYLDQGSRRIPNETEIIRKSVARLEREGLDDSPQYQNLVKHLGTLETTPLTSNYVMFDPGLIDIVKKYAVPGAVGTGVMGELAQQDTYGVP